MEKQRKIWRIRILCIHSHNQINFVSQFFINLTENETCLKVTDTNFYCKISSAEELIVTLWEVNINYNSFSNEPNDYVG